MKRSVCSTMVSFIFLVAAFIGPALASETGPVSISPGEIEQAGTLRQQQAAVAAREQELAEREILLRELEQELDARFDRLAALQEVIQDKLAEIRMAEENHFRRLVRVYSSMKASNVAAILNEMEDDDAVRVLRAMRTEMAAQIMPRLTRKKAVRISKQLGMIE